jgi:hypothetical protein
MDYLDQRLSENGHRDTSWNCTADWLPSRDALVYYRAALYLFADFIDGEGRWHDHNGRLKPELVLGWAELGRCCGEVSLEICDAADSGSIDRCAMDSAARSGDAGFDPSSRFR